jgi:RNA polymerase sigma factor FliA
MSPTILEVAPESVHRLVRENLGLVHHIARQLSATYSMQADFDELVSAGTMGLIKAVEGFDLDRGVAFSTFAAPRIRGAIQDEMRRLDPVPRSLRRKAREVAAARTSLAAVLGRQPESAELAAHLEVDLETFWGWQAEIERSSPVSLSDTADSYDGDRTPLSDTIGGANADLVEEQRLTAVEELAAMREALQQLKEQERTVLTLYYFEELKLHEIATVLGLTESRISQIRTKALQRLRQMMAPLRA